MSCSSPLASSPSEEEGESGGSTACLAEDGGNWTAAGHGIERADEKPLYQEMHQIHP
jgi:hypothetical protein